MKTLFPILVDRKPLVLPLDEADRDALARLAIEEEERRSNEFLESLMRRKAGSVQHEVRVV